MAYLANPACLPVHPADQTRVLRAAAFLHMDSAGCLWTLAKPPGYSRRIPPIGMRHEHMLDALQALVHPGGEALYANLK